MRVILRADAGVVQGTGHVMRCLTLAEELLARGHVVHLMTAPFRIDWLQRIVDASGVIVQPCRQDELLIPEVLELAPDWVVVDSYQIAANAISQLNNSVPVLAIVDGDARAIRASLYLDQNLGADESELTGPRPERMLAGARFALVRDAVLSRRRPKPWLFTGARPVVVSFMGGTDPTGMSVAVASAIIDARDDTSLIVVAPAELHGELRTLIQARQHVELVLPTDKLPDLLARADVVVTAAGTSAWDVCALGIPAVLIAVVDNQVESLTRAVSHGVAVGLDAVHDPLAMESLGPLVSSLVADGELRESLSRNCRTTFDGAGKSRVVNRMEEQVTRK